MSDEATDAAGFGLLYFNARWVDPELGRFAQADTIIPGAGDVQAWDRYAFVNNNPLGFVDPNGHDAVPPAGNIVQINIGLGLNIGPLFLIYASLSLVTDKDGGVQLYYTKRDQDYQEGSSNALGSFEPGSSEKANPTSMLAIGGADLTWGTLDGSNFRKYGTTAFAGKGVDYTLGVGQIAGDAFFYADPTTGQVNPSIMTGVDAGFSVGGPLTIGRVATDSIPLTKRVALPGWAIPMCQKVGMCGSSTSPLPSVGPPQLPEELPPLPPLPGIIPGRYPEPPYTHGR
jgi:RHS repeat-associated protein